MSLFPRKQETNSFIYDSLGLTTGKLSWSVGPDEIGYIRGSVRKQVSMEE